MVFSILSLVGCITMSVEGDREVMHTHLLNPEWRGDAAIHTAGEPRSAVLLVTLPRELAGYDTSRMVYLRRPDELSYYATHQWVESPGRMIAPLLVQVLERTGAWKSVVQTPTIISGDYRLDSSDLALEQRFFEQPNRIRVSLRAQFLDLKHYTVMGTRSFEVSEVAPSEDAYGGVTAANRAIGRLLDDLAMWASGCMTHSADC